ncbi:bZIP transcription factor [Agaribacter marinus]|uniref:Uncharacterized protein n=1 Tax=Agaribacter marinus TaxID=1431249 RepID=A0AA37SX36_9ALTE|nr:bZIP transcription factor [Agaribacter marinus]GLR69750.1 hypothetical protein GCM10007852_06580 [Agaribacter marinus]
MYAKTIFFIVVLGGSAYLAGKALLPESLLDAVSPSALFSPSDKNDAITSKKSDEINDLHISVSTLQVENTQLKDSLQLLKQELSSLKKESNYQARRATDVKPAKDVEPAKSNAVKSYDKNLKLGIADTLANATSVQSEAIEETSSNALTHGSEALGENNVRTKRLQQLAELRDLSTKRQLAAISALAK